MDDLTILAQQHGTDKWGWHTYTPLYHKLLSPMRAKLRAILELGIRTGASLKMWRDYFPAATVYGVDVQPSPSLGNRIVTTRGDLRDFRCYAPLAGRQYDLIVDDASHKPDQQMLSLALLWPTLRPGGIYVIEDVQELASFTRLIGQLFGQVELLDRRGSHNTVDDVLIVIRK